MRSVRSDVQDHVKGGSMHVQIKISSVPIFIRPAALSLRTYALLPIPRKRIFVCLSCRQWPGQYILHSSHADHRLRHRNKSSCCEGAWRINLAGRALKELHYAESLQRCNLACALESRCFSRRHATARVAGARLLSHWVRATHGQFLACPRCWIPLAFDHYRGRRH